METLDGKSGKLTPALAGALGLGNAKAFAVTQNNGNTVTIILDNAKQMVLTSEQVRTLLQAAQEMPLNKFVDQLQRRGVQLQKKVNTQKKQQELRKKAEEAQQAKEKEKLAILQAKLKKRLEVIAAREQKKRAAEAAKDRMRRATGAMRAFLKKRAIDRARLRKEGKTRGPTGAHRVAQGRREKQDDIQKDELQMKKKPSKQLTPKHATISKRSAVLEAPQSMDRMNSNSSKARLLAQLDQSNNFSSKRNLNSAARFEAELLRELEGNKSNSNEKSNNIGERNNSNSKKEGDAVAIQKNSVDSKDLPLSKTRRSQSKSQGKSKSKSQIKSKSTSTSNNSNGNGNNNVISNNNHNRNHNNSNNSNNSNGNRNRNNSNSNNGNNSKNSNNINNSNNSNNSNNNNNNMGKFARIGFLRALNNRIDSRLTEIDEMQRNLLPYYSVENMYLMAEMYARFAAIKRANVLEELRATALPQVQGGDKTFYARALHQKLNQRVPLSRIAEYVLIKALSMKSQGGRGGRGVPAVKVAREYLMSMDNAFRITKLRMQLKSFLKGKKMESVLEQTDESKQIAQKIVHGGYCVPSDYFFTAYPEFDCVQPKLSHINEDYLTYLVDYMQKEVPCDGGERVVRCNGLKHVVQRVLDESIYEKPGDDAKILRDMVEEHLPHNAPGKQEHLNVGRPLSRSNVQFVQRVKDLTGRANVPMHLQLTKQQLKEYENPRARLVSLHAMVNRVLDDMPNMANALTERILDRRKRTVEVIHGKFRRLVSRCSNADSKFTLETVRQLVQSWLMRQPNELQVYQDATGGKVVEDGAVVTHCARGLLPHLALSLGTQVVAGTPMYTKTRGPRFMKQATFAKIQTNGERARTLLYGANSKETGAIHKQLQNLKSTYDEYRHFVKEEFSRKFDSLRRHPAGELSSETNEVVTLLQQLGNDDKQYARVKNTYIKNRVKQHALSRREWGKKRAFLRRMSEKETKLLMKHHKAKRYESLFQAIGLPTIGVRKGTAKVMRSRGVGLQGWRVADGRKEMIVPLPVEFRLASARSPLLQEILVEAESRAPGVLLKGGHTATNAHKTLDGEHFNSTSGTNNKNNKNNKNKKNNKTNKNNKNNKNNEARALEGTTKKVVSNNNFNNNSLFNN